MNEIRWGDVAIAWARPDAVGRLSDDDLAALGPAQLVRHRALDPVRAAGFRAGRRLLRDLILSLGGSTAAPIDSACARCGGDHDVPRTPGFVLSVSHAPDLVVVAAVRGSMPMAVDVEPDTAGERARELAPLFAPRPAPDLAEWTRIEAAIKADGRGVAIDPAAVRLLPDPSGATPREWWAALPDRPTRLRVATLQGPAGYTLSAARG